MATEIRARKRLSGEALMLIGLVTLVVSVIWPAVRFAHNCRMIAETRRAVRTLLNAGARYRLEYGRWPGTSRSPGADVRFGVGGSPNRRLMVLLRGGSSQPGMGIAGNPRGIVFWEPPDWRPGTVGVNDFGELLDPWGMPFQVVVDGDMNGLCDVPRSVYGQIEAGMLVWSYGPDRRSDTPDDIRSW